MKRKSTIDDQDGNKMQLEKFKLTNELKKIHDFLLDKKKVAKIFKQFHFN